MIDGDIVEGAVLDGQIVERTVVDGQIVERKVMDGQMVMDEQVEVTTESGANVNVSLFEWLMQKQFS